MPINSVQQYVQGIINGLPMPNGGYNLAAYITPPSPNIDSATPTAYVWPSTGAESRDGALGGTVPRATALDAPSGLKNTEHMLDIYLVWFNISDDPDADTWFPGMVDALMSVLRFTPDPVKVTDPYDGRQSWLIDTGEHMDYRITVTSVEDESYFRYDALITARIIELFSA